MMAAVLLLLFLVALVVLVVAMLVMAVGLTLASVGAGLLLRDAACGNSEPDPFGVALLADGRLLWVTGATVPVDEPPTPAAFKVAVLRLSAEEAAPAAQPAR